MTDRPKRRVCRGRLYLPVDGKRGPRPAVVISQGLGGPREGREYVYARCLADAGIVALVPDGFGSRGVGEYGDAIRTIAVESPMLVADAFAALEFLRRQDFVIPDRIAIIGFSYGGMVAVLCAYDQIRSAFLGEEAGFVGHVSFYGCSIPRMENVTTTGAPVLMLLGGKDKNVSIARSRRIADDLQRGGSEVELCLFPNAYHEWDGPDEDSFVPFRLRPCRVLIDKQGRFRDGRSGAMVEGRLARLWFILTSGSVFGFRLRRDQDVMRRSTALLGRFLERVLNPWGTEGTRRQVSERKIRAALEPGAAGSRARPVDRPQDPTPESDPSHHVARSRAASP